MGKNYNVKIDEMPTFEEYAAAREESYLSEVGEDFDEKHYNGDYIQGKKSRMLNYKAEYLMELALREDHAKAAEDEAERLTREYNKKIAALGVKHHIEQSDTDKALLEMLQALRENEDGDGNTFVKLGTLPQ